MEQNGSARDALQVAHPPAKRSKKGKKKHQGQASAADYLKVTPLSREADLLREVVHSESTRPVSSRFSCRKTAPNSANMVYQWACLSGLLRCSMLC